MLKLAGYINLFISLLHFAALFKLDYALAITGVTEQMARNAALHPALPFIMTVAVAIAFAVFGIYALSGAGVIKRKLPLLKPILYTIGGIYVLRGIGGILFQYTGEIPGFLQLAFALTALGIGLLYIFGTMARGDRNY